MTASELCELTIQKAAELIRKKAVSPLEITRACLARIE